VLNEVPRHEHVWGIAPRTLNHCTGWRWMVRFTTLPLYTSGKSHPCPLDGRLGAPQSRSWRGGEDKRTPDIAENRTLVVQPRKPKPLSTPPPRSLTSYSQFRNSFSQWHHNHHHKPKCNKVGPQRQVTPVAMQKGCSWPTEMQLRGL